MRQKAALEAQSAQRTVNAGTVIIAPWTISASDIIQFPFVDKGPSRTGTCACSLIFELENIGADSKLHSSRQEGLVSPPTAYKLKRALTIGN